MSKRAGPFARLKRHAESDSRHARARLAVRRSCLVTVAGTSGATASELPAMASSPFRAAPLRAAPRRAARHVTSSGTPGRPRSRSAPRERSTHRLTPGRSQTKKNSLNPISGAPHERSPQEDCRLPGVCEDTRVSPGMKRPVLRMNTSRNRIEQKNERRTWTSQETAKKACLRDKSRRGTPNAETQPLGARRNRPTRMSPVGQTDATSLQASSAATLTPGPHKLRARPPRPTVTAGGC